MQKIDSFNLDNNQYLEFSLEVDKLVLKGKNTLELYERIELQTVESFDYANLEQEIKLGQVMDLGLVEKIGNIFEWGQAPKVGHEHMLMQDYNFENGHMLEIKLKNKKEEIKKKY